MAKVAKTEKLVESLKKLYEKRTALDKQILETEKTLSAAASVLPSVGGAAAARKRTPRKRTPAPKKPPVKK
jgi:hypothetical protein